jgi:hypothetical protein
MSKHHVIEHHWRGATLTTLEFFFDTLEAALEFSSKSYAHTVKIYNEDGELRHARNPDGADTYA